MSHPSPVPPPAVLRHADCFSPKWFNPQPGPKVTNDPIELRLYIAGDSPRSRLALASVRRLDQSPLAGRIRLEVIDVLDEPARAESDRILATPTLLRLAPAPTRRILGDLASLGRLVSALETGAPGSPPEEVE